MYTVDYLECTPYLEGWTYGTRFFQKYSHSPKVLLQYVKWLMKQRYIRTEEDAGFVDAILSAYGA